MRYIAESLSGRSPTEMLIAGVLGITIFFGGMIVFAKILDVFTGR